MPRIEVEGYGAFEVPAGMRLVNALEANGVDILHHCGGYARCLPGGSPSAPASPPG